MTRRRRRAVARSDDWNIVYANLMTILMIFFMALWALQRSTEKGEAYEQMVAAIVSAFGGSADPARMVAAKNADSEKSVVERLKELSSTEDPSRAPRVVVTQERIDVILPEPVLFLSGKSEITQDVGTLIEKLGKILSALPDHEIVVEGHTDDVPLIPGGRIRDNWELSALRALSMVHTLVGAGVPRTSITPIGRGEFEPVLPNTSPENRALNRRLEIHVLRKKA
jgi:chemotaxis protein MotB